MELKWRTHRHKPQATSHKPQERSSGQRTHLVTLRCISYGLAIVLLIAALLKIHLLLTDPLASLKAGRPVWLLWLASLAELSVAWLSVHCKSHQAIWLANVLIFGAFAIFSGASFGDDSCGCLGAVDLPASWLFFLDIAVLSCMLLLCIRIEGNFYAPLQWVKSGTRFLVDEISVFVFIAALSLIIIFWDRYHEGLDQTLSSQIHYPRVVDFGSRKLKDGAFESKLRLTNPNSQPLTILGLESSCSCLFLEKTQDIPAIGPGKTIELRVLIRPVKVGKFKQGMVLYVNDSLVQRFIVVFQGLVVE